MRLGRFDFMVYRTKFSLYRLLSFSSADTCSDDPPYVATGRWYQLTLLSFVFNVIVSDPNKVFCRARDFSVVRKIRS